VIIFGQKERDERNEQTETNRINQRSKKRMKRINVERERGRNKATKK
jgi:hypothetical protein